ncbi:MAG: ASKHA domain-containing protein [Clostridiales bacterium]|nr:ASKHA domain-containing protein [Clostridiales bacterium]
MKIKVLSHGKTIPARKGEVLAEVLQRSGIPLKLFCNQRGLCGKCAVEVVKGKQPELAEKEKFLWEQKILSRNKRLSCLFEIENDIEINVPFRSILSEVPILPAVRRSSVSINPAVKKYVLDIPRPRISSPESVLELLLEGLGMKHLKISPLLLRELGPRLGKAKYKVAVIVHRDKEIIDLRSAAEDSPIFGLAIDVGTTTLVMELVDLETGKTVDIKATLNAQASRGADVISRITYAMSSQEKAGELRTLVLDSLNRMIRQVIEKNNILPSSVYEIVVSGNTAMNHLLLGVPVHSLAVAPYHAVFSRLPYLSGQEVGLAVHVEAKIYFSPNIKSFVGGDIASGLLASRLDRLKGIFLFIDLGTNGEIVLKTGGSLIATSTAAGPAFEGMNISCGMPAFPGAIYKAEDIAGKLKISTLGNEPAKGVCGTGLIDLIAIFLKRGEISNQGAILNREKRLRIANGISLTQDDIRQVQLACAAIKTGIRLMLKRNGLGEAEVDGIYIAGVFGNYLNIGNSMKIGLLPGLEKRKFLFVGNSSLAGARQLLVSLKERERAESLIKKVSYRTLASDPLFQDHFVKALELKSWP